MKASKEPGAENPQRGVGSVSKIPNLQLPDPRTFAGRLKHRVLPLRVLHPQPWVGAQLAQMGPFSGQTPGPLFQGHAACEGQRLSPSQPVLRTPLGPLLTWGTPQMTSSRNDSKEVKQTNKQTSWLVISVTIMLQKASMGASREE